MGAHLLLVRPRPLVLRLEALAVLHEELAALVAAVPEDGLVRLVAVLAPASPEHLGRERHFGGIE